MLILGHRGAPKEAPENTVASFKEAVAQGADGVELDVLLCGSGELVVCHDERLGRLAGTDVAVADLSLAELQQLDVGRHLGFSSSAAIPTLDEVMAVLPAPLLVNLEIKCDRFDDRGLAVRVAEYVERAGIGDRVILSSFNPLCLLRVRSAYPHLRRGHLIGPGPAFGLRDLVGTPVLTNYAVHPYRTGCTEARMRRWARAGYKITTWTVDDPAEAARLRDLGLDYCITNTPRALREALARSQAR